MNKMTNTGTAADGAHNKMISLDDLETDELSLALLGQSNYICSLTKPPTLSITPPTEQTFHLPTFFFSQPPTKLAISVFFFDSRRFDVPIYHFFMTDNESHDPEGRSKGEGRELIIYRLRCNQPLYG